jgi:glycosyltransferase involved in cell wall biosynthesis
MKVSVIIPVRNDEKRLGRLLQSLNAQTIVAELIVIDNGSSDDSAKVAKEYGAQVFIYPGLRVGALRNRGVEASSGDVIAFVDSDHEVPADWIDSGVRALFASDAIGAVGSHYLPPVNSTWVQRVWGIHRLRGSREAEPVDWLGAGNLIVRRIVFEQIGGFREDLVAAEDVDLCHRIRENGKEVICDRKIQSVHHGEPRTLRDFFRKEYWRGSSGVKAWISQGFPLSDLPSLVWPVWHLALGVICAVLMACSSLQIISNGMRWLGVAGILWLLPSILLALKTGVTERRWGAVLPLAALYFAYGLARAAALFK